MVPRVVFIGEDDERIVDALKATRRAPTQRKRIIHMYFTYIHIYNTHVQLLLRHSCLYVVKRERESESRREEKGSGARH